MYTCITVYLYGTQYLIACGYKAYCTYIVSDIIRTVSTLMEGRKARTIQTIEGRLGSTRVDRSTIHGGIKMFPLDIIRGRNNA